MIKDREQQAEIMKVAYIMMMQGLMPHEIIRYVADRFQLTTEEVEELKEILKYYCYDFGIV
jgi:hypothetical protein